MLLDDKNAIIYGGGGSVGGAMAKAFAAQGARVHLAGRTAASLDKVAGAVREAGGRAETAVLDALDEAAVDAHAAEVGRIDISVNVTSSYDVQGTPLVEMAVDDYLSPVAKPLRSQFLTTRAAARHMIPRRGGVILFFGGEGDKAANRMHRLGGLLAGFAAVEALRRQLAAELGEHGIRVVTLATSGIVESLPAGMPEAAEIGAGITATTLLGRAATLADVGNAAVFAASDWARTMTGASLNISCGAFLD
ncbi:3-oxoacyl-ACP reductase [Paractinoplanes deccanensis]|uniref:3-oxoacyl-ACP reductase n=1 Tax=Paractinoplanes deccanensis TaxID=113561 RepID=A0ABQ3Y8W8_9ACTN|nr:SDR family oxidoreductase [Actinoplanes deccanensis]GID76424.1 3-oxoacyl-ACP reductase [Actinoplanes deccanensis]